GPLLRSSLVQLAEQAHVLFVTMHHVVADGWSLGLLISEVVAGYRALVRGEPPVLTALPVQYADFAVWQRAWLTGDVLEQQLAYWRRRLDDVPPLVLPTDHSRPAVRSGRGAAIGIELPAEIVRKLHTVARDARATLYMVLLAGFELLLHRYSGQ